MKLNKDVLFNNKVSPICLSDIKNKDTYINMNLTIAGWGYNKNTNNLTSINLQQATVTLIKNTDERCEIYLNDYNRNLMYCALNTVHHSNACLGDSGGPLALYKKDHWILLGIKCNIY